jgi:hypothetical protein
MDFDRELQTLSRLAKNEQTVMAFEGLYGRLLTAVVNLHLVDGAGIASGLYKTRLSALQALGREQVAWAREHWPEETRAAEAVCKRARDTRDRRERATWN